MAEGDGPSTDGLPTVPDYRGGNRLPVRVDHQRDGSAMSEEVMLDGVTRSREDLVLVERDRLQPGRQQINIRGQQCCKKTVTNSDGARHRR
jgi:hypothetical protein